MLILEKINLGLDCCVGGIGCSKRCPYHSVSPDEAKCKEALLNDIYGYWQVMNYSKEGSDKHDS